MATSSPVRDFQEFLATKVAPIPGWLNDEAALFTAHMVAAQRALGISGPTLEIGVFKGKYLAVLYALSRPGEAVVGVDLFIGAENNNPDPVIKEVSANIAAACGESARLKILAADSCATTSATLRGMGGEAFRFVSVDGGHTREVVRNDLTLAAAVLKDGGIIALDDAFNHTTPGVIEATAEFFLRDGAALAPFALCYNKLFLTTPGHHARYLAETRAFIEAVDWLPANERTTRWIAENRAVGFSPEMFGYEIIPFL